MRTVSTIPVESMTQEQLYKEWELLEYLVNADDTITPEEYKLIAVRQLQLENALQ